MKAIRGKKKGATGESYFLSHANTVIIEETVGSSTVKKTLSEKLAETATPQDIATVFE